MRRIAAIAAVLVGALVAVGAAATSSSSKTPTYLVRAIFDNAGFAVSGEDVRIAGAPVGSIQALDVTKQNQAAVTLAITNPAFTPFHQNATCAIRPQSLIGERYVDCFPGSSSTPALTKITNGPGTGSYYLPVTRTSSPIDADIVQDIYQLPIRERFALILNELGTGLAARGADLNAVIHRADPALGDTDKVVQILAKQNRQLAQLSTDSNRVLTPLAQVKHAIADFVVQANTTAKASASRARGHLPLDQRVPTVPARAAAARRRPRPARRPGHPADDVARRQRGRDQPAVREPDAVRQSGEAGADRARELLGEVAAGAASDAAARAAAEPGRHTGRAGVEVA